MRHLLSIDDLDRADIERVLDRAASFAEVAGREIKKVPALRGRTVVNLFFEASTRTSSSFELAAKRLSADVVSIRAATSSVTAAGSPAARRRQGTTMSISSAPSPSARSVSPRVAESGALPAGTALVSQPALVAVSKGQ